MSKWVIYAFLRQNKVLRGKCINISTWEPLYGGQFWWAMYVSVLLLHGTVYVAIRRRNGIRRLTWSSMKIKVPDCGQSDPGNLMDRDSQPRSLMARWKIAARVSLLPFIRYTLLAPWIMAWGLLMHPPITEQFIMWCAGDGREFSVNMP